MRPFAALLAVVLATGVGAAVVACGGRTDLGDLLLDNGIGPSATAPGFDGGIEITPDGAVLELGPDGAVLQVGPDGSITAVVNPDGGAPVIPGPPAPHCIVSSTCSVEVFSHGWAQGGKSLETISVTCEHTPQVVQQLVGGVGGVWTSLEPFSLDDNYQSASTAITDLNTELGTLIEAPPPASPEGSIQRIRACAISDQGTTCDPRSNVAVAACTVCKPRNCGLHYMMNAACGCEPGICFCGGEYPACDPVCGVGF